MNLEDRVEELEKTVEYLSEKLKQLMIYNHCTANATYTNYLQLERFRESFNNGVAVYITKGLGRTLKFADNISDTCRIEGCKDNINLEIVKGLSYTHDSDSYCNYDKGIEEYTNKWKDKLDVKNTHSIIHDNDFKQIG